MARSSARHQRSLVNITQKADVFALGVLFYAIEERKYVEVQGAKRFGAFVDDNEGNMVPVGLQMVCDRNAGLRVFFDKTDKHLVEIIRLALLLDQKQRPSAATIQEKLEYLS